MGSMKDYYTRMEDAGYSHEEIEIRLNSTDREWQRYLQESANENVIGQSKNKATKSKYRSEVESYEPFMGDDGRMAYVDENGCIHKEYLDEDDMYNDPDYWDDAIG